MQIFKLICKRRTFMFNDWNSLKAFTIFRSTLYETKLFSGNQNFEVIGTLLSCLGINYRSPYQVIFNLSSSLKKMSSKWSHKQFLTLYLLTYFVQSSQKCTECITSTESETSLSMWFEYVYCNQKNILHNNSRMKTNFTFFTANLYKKLT